MVPAQDHLQRATVGLNVEDLDDSPTRLLRVLHRARHSQILSLVRELQLKSALFVCVEFEDSLVRKQRLEVEELLPRFEADVVLQSVNLLDFLFVLAAVGLLSLIVY